MVAAAAAVAGYLIVDPDSSPRDLSTNRWHVLIGSQETAEWYRSAERPTEASTRTSTHFDWALHMHPNDPPEIWWV